MATTNFLQFNPTGANQDNDAQYLADALRTGGAPLDGVLPSKTFNKVEFQASTFVAAFCQMLAAKGYSTSDADIAALAGILANVVTDADLANGITTVAYATTVAFNANTSNGFQINLTGPVTSSTITGISPGQLIAFYLAQDAAGGRTFSWPAGIVGTLPIDLTPNAVSLMLFRADASGTLRAITPLMSSTGTIVVTGLTFAAGAPAGTVLVGDGTKFAAVAPTFVNGTSGYYKDPVSGRIEQWGTVLVGPGGSHVEAGVTFPIPFPTAVWNIQVTPNGKQPNGSSWSAVTAEALNQNASGFTAALDSSNTGQSFTSAMPAFWRAIGN